MRLIHLNDGALMELKDAIVAQGQCAATLNSPFISSEQDVIENLMQTFKRYSRATISFDAPIVENLCLINRQRENGAMNDQMGLVSKNKQQN